MRSLSPFHSCCVHNRSLTMGTNLNTPGEDRMTSMPTLDEAKSGGILSGLTRSPCLGLVVALILAVHFILAVTAVRDKSTTFDEIVHAASGYSYWKYNDYRINPANLNLPQRLMALPLVLGDFKFPPLDDIGWQTGEGIYVGRQFFYHCGNDLASMLLRGRTMMALLSVALGLMLFFYSRRLFGDLGGLLSLFLFSFDPTVLANAPLMCTDLAGALFFFASIWLVWRMLERFTLPRLLLSAMAMGALFLSKMSGLIILPVFLLLLLLRVISRQPLEVCVRQCRWQVHSRPRRGLLLLAATAVHAAVVVAMIWTFFGWRYEALAQVLPGDLPVPWQELPANYGLGVSIIQFARDHHLLPEAYLYGYAGMLSGAQVRPAFLNGHFDVSGWRSFFPYTFAVKTPLMTLSVVVLAMAAAVRKWQSAGSSQGRPVWRSVAAAADETSPLWLLLACYWTVAIFSHLNIGHRHILPVYPPMFVLAGAAAYWLTARPRYPRIVLVVCLLLLGGETLYRWPNYLAYFNQIVGGPANGYKHLVDSSLDWGQDLPGLKKWLDDRGLGAPGREPVFLAYFGTAEPGYYQIHARQLPSYFSWQQQEIFPLTTGVYCISATQLQNVYTEAKAPWSRRQEQMYRQLVGAVKAFESTANDPAARAALIQSKPQGREYWKNALSLYEEYRFGRLCAYLRQREPDDQVNYSILIYRINQQEVEKALYGEPAELAAYP